MQESWRPASSLTNVKDYGLGQVQILWWGCLKSLASSLALRFGFKRKKISSRFLWIYSRRTETLPVHCPNYCILLTVLRIPKFFGPLAMCLVIVCTTFHLSRTKTFSLTGCLIGTTFVTLSSRFFCLTRSN
jgi:hypothetical protein